MTARCRRCGKHWIISALQQIPHTGYICLHCAVRGRLIKAGVIKRGDK